MEHQTIGRLLLTIFAIVQAVATLTIDLGPTHATNPRWPGHARFHLVSQNSDTLLLALLAVGMIWAPKFNRDDGFYLACCLAAIPLLSYLVAVVFRRFYAGTLYDPNGMQPAKIALLGKVRQLNLNVVAIMGGFITIVISVGIYR